MTNQELLTLAAKAAGYQVSTNGTDFWLMEDDIEIQHWNPLKQDDHALRLAVDLNIKFRFHSVLNQALAWRNFQEFRVNAEDHNNDFHAATRLAIVKAAANDGGVDDLEHRNDLTEALQAEVERLKTRVADVAVAAHAYGYDQGYEDGWDDGHDDNSCRRRPEWSWDQYRSQIEATPDGWAADCEAYIAKAKEQAAQQKEGYVLVLVDALREVLHTASDALMDESTSSVFDSDGIVSTWYDHYHVAELQLINALEEQEPT